MDDEFDDFDDIPEEDLISVLDAVTAATVSNNTSARSHLSEPRASVNQIGLGTSIRSFGTAHQAPVSRPVMLPFSLVLLPYPQEAFIRGAMAHAIVLGLIRP